MAPIKISHVVSFSSQDPRYPVENLLREEGQRPWLGCPRERRRVLRVELQLERASPIGYVDVGNCGCAFLQLEVGRSSWPPDRPFLTLVPSVTLMSPPDSKLGRNRCRVRMFKEADFLALAVGQKWDRLRVTCSQPFSRGGQFGLSFLRLRTPQDAQTPPRPPTPPPPQNPGPDSQPGAGPRCFIPAFSRILFPNPPSSRREEEEEGGVRSRLRQLEPGGHGAPPLSRPARMLLSAARKRAARAKIGTDSPGGGTGGDTGVPTKDTERPGSSQDVPAAPSPAGRALPAPPRAGGRGRGRRRRERGARRGGDSEGDTGVCPICSGRFSLDLLPLHASRCGEEDPPSAWPSSTAPPQPPPSWGSSSSPPSWGSCPPPSWVSCPICHLPFGAAEVEGHASACGEQG